MAVQKLILNKILKRNRKDVNPLSHRLKRILLATVGSLLISANFGAISASAAETAASDEATQVGWYTSEDGKLYYYYEDGTCAQEETTLSDGYTYVFAADGALETGWQTVDGLRYYYDPEIGLPQFGWISYQDCLYYVDEETGKLVGEQEINDVRYAFDEYGCVQTGWVTFSDNTVYYYEEDATVVTGWKTTNGKTYYLTTDGALTGMQEIDGSTYYFDTDGVMQWGWVTLDGDSYYFDENGVMQTGWMTISGISYYFDSTGVLVDAGYESIQLDVPDYKQYDAQWANTTITYSTIGKVGCLVTSLAMKYSAENDTEVTPDEILSMLTFSGDDLQWTSYTDLGYTMEKPGSSMTQSVMQTIYTKLLEGKPVIVGAKNSSSQHYVVVTGYTGSTGASLLASDFLINDPGSSTRTTLSAFLTAYPSLYVIVY